MKLVLLKNEEFKNWALENDEISFHQTLEWANLKKTNGWNHYFVGLKNNNKILAGALLLEKQVPIIHKTFLYSPRGFLIDYHDKKLLKSFTDGIKEFAKEKKAIFVKIDPYVMYKERDKDGNIVENGIDNSDVVNNLKELGYKHFGFNLMQDTLQPRWIYTITTKDRTEEDIQKDMDSKTRQILRKNERLGIKIREIEEDELSIFKDIMQHTGERRDFIDRPFSYYQNMWKNLHDSGILKILLAEINFDEEIKNGKVLVDFYADWCGPCKALGEVLETLEDVSILKINVDKHQDIAMQFGVMSIPTILLFKDGKQLKKNIGFMNKEELETWLKD